MFKHCCRHRHSIEKKAKGHSTSGSHSLHYTAGWRTFLHCAIQWSVCGSIKGDWVSRSNHHLYSQFFLIVLEVELWVTEVRWGGTRFLPSSFGQWRLHSSLLWPCRRRRGGMVSTRKVFIFSFFFSFPCKLFLVQKIISFKRTQHPCLLLTDQIKFTSHVISPRYKRVDMQRIYMSFIMSSFYNQWQGADAAISRGMASGSSVAKPAAALTMRTAAWEATSSFVRLWIITDLQILVHLVKVERNKIDVTIPPACLHPGIGMWTLLISTLSSLPS